MQPLPFCFVYLIGLPARTSIIRVRLADYFDPIIRKRYLEVIFLKVPGKPKFTPDCIFITH